MTKHSSLSAIKGIEAVDASEVKGGLLGLSLGLGVRVNSCTPVVHTPVVCPPTPVVCHPPVVVTHPVSVGVGVNVGLGLNLNGLLGGLLNFGCRPC